MQISPLCFPHGCGSLVLTAVLLAPHSPPPEESSLSAVPTALSQGASKSVFSRHPNYAHVTNKVNSASKKGNDFRRIAQGVLVSPSPCFLTYKRPHLLKALITFHPDSKVKGSPEQREQGGGRWVGSRTNQEFTNQDASLLPISPLGQLEEEGEVFHTRAHSIFTSIFPRALQLTLRVKHIGKCHRA